MYLLNLKISIIILTISYFINLNLVFSETQAKLPDYCGPQMKAAQSSRDEGCKNKNGGPFSVIEDTFNTFVTNFQNYQTENAAKKRDRGDVNIIEENTRNAQIMNDSKVKAFNKELLLALVEPMINEQYKLAKLYSLDVPTPNECYKDKEYYGNDIDRISNNAEKNMVAVLADPDDKSNPKKVNPDVRENFEVSHIYASLVMVTLQNNIADVRKTINDLNKKRANMPYSGGAIQVEDDCGNSTTKRCLLSKKIWALEKEEKQLVKEMQQQYALYPLLARPKGVNLFQFEIKTSDLANNLVKQIFPEGTSQAMSMSDEALRTHIFKRMSETDKVNPQVRENLFKEAISGDKNAKNKGMIAKINDAINIMCQKKGEDLYLSPGLVNKVLQNKSAKDKFAAQDIHCLMLSEIKHEKTQAVVNAVQGTVGVAMLGLGAASIVVPGLGETLLFGGAMLAGGALFTGVQVKDAFDSEASAIVAEGKVQGKSDGDSAEVIKLREKAHLSKMMAIGTAALTAVDGVVVAFKVAEVVANTNRLAKAESIIGELNPVKKQAVLKAHEVGMKEVGKDGSRAKVGNYTQAQLREKAQILKDAGFGKEETRKLMENGIVGSSKNGLSTLLESLFGKKKSDSYSNEAKQAESMSESSLSKVEIKIPEYEDKIKVGASVNVSRSSGGRSDATITKILEDGKVEVTINGSSARKVMSRSDLFLSKPGEVDSFLSSAKVIINRSTLTSDEQKGILDAIKFMSGKDYFTPMDLKMLSKNLEKAGFKSDEVEKIIENLDVDNGHVSFTSVP